MHILMTADTVGGVWTYALELARAVAAYDVSISLATMGARLTSDQRLDASRLDNLDVFESDYRLEWMDDAWDDVADAGVWLWEIARDVRPDVIHLNQFAHGASHWNAPCLVVAHSCVLSWHQCVRGQAAGAEWDLYRNLVKCGLRAADLVAAPTTAMLDTMQYFYGPLQNTRVIPNGRRCDLRAQVPKQCFIFTAGRMWDEAKNVAAVAAVAPRLAWPVYAAGLPHPSARAAGEDGPAGVTFLGRFSSQQMQDAYQRAAIYALPARYEPFGLTALEAALAGCALVLGDIPTLREVWGDAAVFVPPDDHQALADAINGLIADERWRSRLVAKASNRAQTLNARRMAQGYLRAYGELLGQRNPIQHRSRRAAYSRPQAKGVIECTS
jgi:glycogen synthase